MEKIRHELEQKRKTELESIVNSIPVGGSDTEHFCNAARTLFTSIRKKSECVAGIINHDTHVLKYLRDNWEPVWS